MSLPSLSALTALVQWTGIAMPTLYAGITFQYSLTMTFLARTSPTPNAKLLARQWLALYQQGPRWVPPIVLSGFLANLALAFLPRHPSPFSPASPRGSGTTTLYLAAAITTIAILPLTFLYYEPGVNGACKWKVESLLREEERASGLAPAEERSGAALPSVLRHSASEASKRWAERADMRELVLAWARTNHPRWVVGLGAGLLSFGALVVGGGDV